jgi:hypothetical protein
MDVFFTGMRRMKRGKILYLRDLKSALYSPFPYILVTAVCLLSTYFLRNFMAAVSALSLTVSTDPSRLPLSVSVIAMALYLGITSSTSLSHEREQKTLEVLFYGPVTPAMRIGALFLRDLSVFLLALGFFFVHALVVALTANLAAGAQSLRTAGLSLPLVCPMIGLSLLLSAMCRKTRSSVLLFISLFVLMAGLQAVFAALSSIPLENASLFVLYIKRALSAFLEWAKWISPFSYLSRIGGMLSDGGPYEARWTVLAALAYSAALLAAACLALARKGQGI